MRRKYIQNLNKKNGPRIHKKKDSLHNFVLLIVFFLLYIISMNCIRILVDHIINFPFQIILIISLHFSMFVKPSDINYIFIDGRTPMPRDISICEISYSLFFFSISSSLQNYQWINSVLYNYHIQMLNYNDFQFWVAKKMF